MTRCLKKKRGIYYLLHPSLFCSVANCIYLLIEMVDNFLFLCSITQIAALFDRQILEIALIEKYIRAVVYY